MKKEEALSILKISGEYNPASIKKSYRKLCSEYHPDRNPVGLHMMQIINVAYEILQNESGNADDEESCNYSDDVLAALNALRGLNLTIEICGTWVWVSGNTKEHREALKEANFKWAPKKAMWYFRPAGERTFSRGKFTIDEIRERHGSSKFKFNECQKLSA